MGGDVREGGREERLSFFLHVMQYIHPSAKVQVKHKMGHASLAQNSR